MKFTHKTLKQLNLDEYMMNTFRGTTADVQGKLLENLAMR